MLNMRKHSLWSHPVDMRWLNLSKQYVHQEHMDMTDKNFLDWKEQTCSQYMDNMAYVLHFVIISIPAVFNVLKPSHPSC